MMERPSFSSSLARAKTERAPSPVSSEMRDAICAMVESRMLPLLEAGLHATAGPFGGTNDNAETERGAGTETPQEMRKIMQRRFCSPCAAVCAAELDVSKGTEEYGTGRMGCCNLPGEAAVLLLCAVPEGTHHEYPPYSSLHFSYAFCPGVCRLAAGR